jgi:tetratricopeptide (TPR) repeat protein
MAIDTYAPCPGGTGKKIKFCCADLVGDLEQLDTLVEGDQISAALDQVRRLEEKHPGRACLMATRTKLELASKRYAEAAASSQAFLNAFPDNPLALGHAAITDALAGRVQEAAASFDKARAAAAAEGAEVSAELVRIAATLVQAAAQLGHVGFAQGIVEWLSDAGLGNEEERRLLAAIVGSSGVPAALRTRMRLEPVEGDSPWRIEFDAALDHARHWRLLKALTAFRSLKGVAGDSRPLFTNIAVLCEMLARPVEASEAWLAVARMSGTPNDDAVEMTGRAITLETEADPDRSPLVRFASRIAPLTVPAGEEGSAAIDLLEDTIRHAGRFDQAAFDRAQWVARGAAPPRSAWRVYDEGAPARLLATLLIFGRQTDREPEAVLQGFAADIEQARPAVEAAVGCTFGAEMTTESVPAVSPTNWLMGSQFRMQQPTSAPPPAPAGQPSFFDSFVEEQRKALWDRFLAVWPDTPLPELLGKTPREALRDPQTARRVAALVEEGEATARRPDASAAWTAVRERLGMQPPATVDSTQPFEDAVPPLRWHRLDMSKLSIDELRGILVTSLDAGFEKAAGLAAEALAARPDATPADRWEALGALEERATSSVRKLEIIAELRGIAKTLKANDGMLDVAELRVRMQRGDEADVVRLLEHVRREHGRDQQVIQAFAEVLMEAGVDISALAGRAMPGGGAGPAGGAAIPAAAPAAEAGKLWTPGGETSAAGGGEKKVIWTPN